MLTYPKKPSCEWLDKYYLGTNSNGRIYLSPPSFDCGWYWGFGYLVNKDCHYHLAGVDKNMNLYDALIAHFHNNTFIFSTNIKENEYSNKLWTFCELIETSYALKKTAEVLDRGGIHYTENPCSDLIKNHAEVKRINETVLPAIFNKINVLLKEVTAEYESAP